MDTRWQRETMQSLLVVYFKLPPNVFRQYQCCITSPESTICSHSDASWTCFTSCWVPKVSCCFCFCLQKKVDPDSLTAESKRYMERVIKLGKRNGLHLPKETQEVAAASLF